MTTATSTGRSVLDAVRIALGASGAVSLLVGLLILFWPGRTAMIATGIIAVWAIAGGVVYAALGGLSRSVHGGARAGHLLLGALFVLGGIAALINLGAATDFLAVFVGVLVGVLWIVEGVVALSTAGDTASRGATILFAVLSILAGVILLFTPLFAAAVLWWLLGISLIVLGAVQIVRAVQFGRALRGATR